MRSAVAMMLLLALVAIGCKYTGSDGVDKLSPEHRAIVIRYGFPEWHKLEKANYGRGLEHAVLVAAALASGKSVDEVRALQAQSNPDQGTRGYEDAMFAFGAALSGGSIADLKKSHQKLSPRHNAPTRPEIHWRPASCLVAGAMISGKSVKEAVRMFKAIDSDVYFTERETGHMALACMLSEKSPKQVVAIFEKLHELASHSGVAGALTIGVAVSGVSPVVAYKDWEVVKEQELCGPVDAAILVSGGLLGENRTKIKVAPPAGESRGSGEPTGGKAQ